MKICEDGRCTGCGLCMAVCPVNAIEMVQNEQGFAEPVINDNKCIECGRCRKKCIAEGYKRANSAKEVYAACLKNTEELKEVSSGGAFWALAEAFLNEGAVVYGAKQKDVYTVCHVRTDSVDDAKGLRRSKYLQSDMTECYKLVKKDLEEGKTVLFSGTPCQVAAIYSYIGENDKLFTCEIVCHGVPSIRVFEKYISELEKKNNNKIKDIVFRNKNFGWGKNHYCISFYNGTELLEPSVSNPFHSTYLAGMISRESCGDCRFAKLPRTADLVLADYWQYKGELLDKSEGLGVSLLVCTTEKGMTMIEKASDYIYVEASDIMSASSSCRHLDHAPGKSIYREMFLDDIAKSNRSFEAVYRRYMSNGNNPADIFNKVIRRIGYEKKRRTGKTDK